MGKVRVALAGNDPVLLSRLETALASSYNDIGTLLIDHVGTLADLMKAKADILLIDHDPPASDALEVIKKVREQDPDFPVIILTPSDDGTLSTEALCQGVDCHANRDLDHEKLHLLLGSQIERLARMVRDRREARMADYRLQTMVQIADKRQSPFHEMAHFVLERMVEISSSTIGYIATVDLEGRTLNMFAWSQGGMKECRTSNRPILYNLDETGLWGEPVRQGRPIMVNDYAKDGQYRKGVPEGHVPLHRVMAIPIFNRGKIVATCGVANKDEDYTERDLRHLQLLMNSMGDLYDVANRDVVLHEAEKRYEAIMRKIPVAVALLDAEGVLVDANDLFMNMVGNGIQRNAALVCDDELTNGIMELYKECRELPAGSKRILHHMRGDEHIHIRSTASPLLDKSNRFNGAILVMDDISSEYEANKTLERTAHQLKTVDQITRHDVMNQLQALYGYIGLMKEVQDPGMSERLLSRMEHILDIISDQMNFSRTYQSLGVHRPLWLNLHNEVRAGISDSHGIDLQVDLDGLEVLADSALNKVFYNLFENTLRHGGDVSQVWIGGELEEDGSLTIIYRDDGKGVPLHQKQNIFQKGVGRNTGLGMFLVREILSMTDVRIEETGIEGEGVCFKLSFPPGIHRQT